ncbi:MAG: hypothetical protein HRU70_13405 [Phycisphaeraceae bacterium]|nr:MAG: hypothetical protein HRU70_13405 [Phycisphaeraceae bacterium]
MAETPSPAPTPSTAPPTAPAAAPAALPGGFKPVVSFEEFAKLDLRVAKVVEAVAHPSADRLLKLKVDDGSGVPRQICAGIREYVKAEDLVGKSIVIAANLAPRTIRGEESRGMLLAASDAPKDAGGGERRLALIAPEWGIAPGSVVS